ncbi:MAG: hypothetical protein ABSG49_06425 [Methanoregula sp.]
MSDGMIGYVLFSGLHYWVFGIICLDYSSFLCRNPGIVANLHGFMKVQAEMAIDGWNVFVHRDSSTKTQTGEFPNRILWLHGFTSG